MFPLIDSVKLNVHLCLLPLFQKYKTIKLYLCQFLGQQSSLFARALQEIETRQVVVGINFGHAEWPIY